MVAIHWVHVEKANYLHDHVHLLGLPDVKDGGDVKDKKFPDRGGLWTVPREACISYEPWDGMGYTAKNGVTTALMNVHPSIHTSVIFIIPLYHTFIAVDDSNKLIS